MSERFFFLNSLRVSIYFNVDYYQNDVGRELGAWRHTGRSPQLSSVVYDGLTGVPNFQRMFIGRTPYRVRIKEENTIIKISYARGMHWLKNNTQYEVRTCVLQHIVHACTNVAGRPYYTVRV